MSLQHYLQMAYKEVHLTSEAELSMMQHLNGTLQSDRENLILVYGGSFNPPHRGHIDVLLSGLRPEIAAVAIVILPSEDFHLRNKVANSHPDFFLHQKRRADIWNAIPSIPRARVWVWTSTWYPFKPFTEALVRSTKADGFNLAFSHLIGPDNLNPRDPLMILPYELPRVLVTNKARQVAAQFLPDGKPAMWNGFGEWSRLMHDYGHGLDDRGVGQAEVVLWTCTGVGDRRGYYLQYSKPVSADINSTNLRRALIQNHLLDEASLNQLSTKALLKLLAPILQGN